jgi:hypothetical protein
VELIGSEDLLTETAQRFFVARAISHVAAKNTVQDTVSRVMEKIEDSIRRYYYQEQDTSHIEKRLIDAWIQMTQGFVEQLRTYMYDEKGRRNNKGLALHKYNRSGEVEVIVFEMEEEMDGSGTTEWR